MPDPASHVSSTTCPLSSSQAALIVANSVVGTDVSQQRVSTPPPLLDERNDDLDELGLLEPALVESPLDAEELLVAEPPELNELDELDELELLELLDDEALAPESLDADPLDDEPLDADGLDDDPLNDDPLDDDPSDSELPDEELLDALLPLPLDAESPD